MSSDRAARRLIWYFMDSYLHSGAVNRHHYALAHKVENASVQDADMAIWAEVDRIRTLVARGSVSWPTTTDEART